MTRVMWGLLISLILLGGGPRVWSHEAKGPYQEAVRAYSQNRDGEGLDAVKRALNIYPNYAEAHFVLGLIAARQHKVAEATEAFQKTEGA